jgi:2-aminoadipate transaminase
MRCAALQRSLPPGSEWQAPQGGMFFWLRLPEGCDAAELLDAAVARGIAYVPGAAFFAHAPDRRTLRLSFVTLSTQEIDDGVAVLGQVVREHLDRLGELTP